MQFGCCIYEGESLRASQDNGTHENQASDTGNMFEDPPTSTLYLSARLPKGTKTFGLIIHRPRVIVDKYVGYPSDRVAPQWTRRTPNTLQFQQPRAAFADIFLKLSINKYNRRQPGLPFRMHEWAKSALVSLATLIYYGTLIVCCKDPNMAFALWK